MFYLLEENGTWHEGKKVLLPTKPIATELTPDNTDNDYGWEFHETPPTEFIEWQKTKSNE